VVSREASGPNLTTMSSARLRHRRQPAAALAWWTAAVAGATTVAVIGLPFLRFAYRAPAFHVVLETTNAVIALVVAYLVYGRFRERRGAQDLLLVMALCTVAIANLVMTALPSAFTLARDEDFSRWTALAVRFLGTLLLVTAALTPTAPRLHRPQVIAIVLAVAGVVLTAGAVGVAYGDLLPPTVDASQPLDARRPVLAAHALVLTTQAVGALLYSVAAVAFTRQASRTGDELVRWVGAGCVLAAAARVHYLLFPSLYSEYVYTGDLLRLGFYLFLLIGAAREIRSYWALRTRAAVLEDRRRMARDLHDGLAQELSYLWTQTRSLSGGEPDARTVERVGAAAGRALEEARRAIAALTRPLDEPFVRVLQQSLDHLGSRYEVELVADLDPAAAVSAEHGESLLRVVTEAVRNAVRHGHAAKIEVELTARPLRLTIRDDGQGFTPGPVATGAGGGFGITSMRERTEGIGGEFRLTSAPGDGTTVEVTLP
jgi:signal transduction histidine kinase